MFLFSKEPENINWASVCGNYMQETRYETRSEVCTHTKLGCVCFCEFYVVLRILMLVELAKIEKK